MHTVIQTGAFLADAADVGLSEDEREEIVNAISRDPRQGVVMAGTGGARKVRFAGRGKGKSGGYRVVTYYAADDVPVFMLAALSKGERANLSNTERNELRKELSGLVDDYRASVKAQVAKLKKGAR
ncbi:MAG: type II toxin-antitoxin system RelE/ParE family toxin [Xanthobacteraceae bacterium]